MQKYKKTFLNLALTFLFILFFTYGSYELHFSNCLFFTKE